MKQGIGTRWIILAGLAIFFLVVLFFNIRSHQQPSYVKRTVDKDTGEQLLTEPNKTAETGGAPKQTILLGSEKLLKAGLTQGQFLLVKDSLLNYARINLQAKYDAIKILPESFTSTGNEIKAELKLGDNGAVLPLAITYSELIYVRVVVSAEEASMKYDSGQLVVPGATPLEEGEDYGGDGTPPDSSL